MREAERVEQAKIELEIHQAMLSNSPRYSRAKNFADQIAHLVRDFTPQDRRCFQRMHDFLLESAFRANVQIIEVRPEWDEMDKLKIEAAINELKMTPFVHDKT